MSEANEQVNGSDSVSQIEAFQKGWAADDIKWLGQVNPIIQPIALRHGRKLFALAMSTGMISEALGAIHKMGGRYKPVAEAIAVVMSVSNNLLSAALEGYGLTHLQLDECKGDIERMVAIHAASLNEGEGKTASGLIITKH